VSCSVTDPTTPRLSKARDYGPILQPSEDGWDAGGTAWGCAYKYAEDPQKTFLYYSGADDKSWTRTAIGLAISTDGISFRKEANPVVDGGATQFNSGISITPAVAHIRDRFYMFFAGGRRSARFPRLARKTKIGVAVADDPRGPWTEIRPIASPRFGWEGLSIDLGPSLVDLGDGEVLAYYSNSMNNLPLTLLGQGYMKHLRRRIGILRIKVNSPKSIQVDRYNGNPLRLNGPKGSPSESVFCPGHLTFADTHYLIPTMGTYSIAFPFRQYIGFVTANSPYFPGESQPSILISGPAKKESTPGQSDVAFDTPSPIASDGKIYLYYSVQHRQDSIWQTSLTLLTPETK